MVGPLSRLEKSLHDHAETCALQLRSDPLTDQILDIGDHGSAEYKDLQKELIHMMQNMMRRLFDDDPALSAATESWFGDDILPHLWILIADWFNHCFVGTRLPEEQVWSVD